MAQSILTYLQKVQDGNVFYEGFENINWQSAEGWNVVQGTPVISNATAEQGLRSFQCSGTGSTLCIIEKSPIFAPYIAPFSYMSYWFFDDSTQTTQPGPYAKVQMTSTHSFSVGVRNSVSTGFYSYGPVGSSTDAPTTATTIARTTGWHQFVLMYGFAGSNPAIYLYIDGVQAAISISGTPTQFYYFYIQSGSTSDSSGGTFGYFDEVNFFINNNLQIVNLYSKVINIYDASNAFISARTPSGGGASFNFSLNSTPMNYPESLYIEISDTVNSKALQFRSILLQINPGDVYAYQPISFAHKVTDWQPRESDLLNQNQSTSGVMETLFNGFKPKHTFTIKNGIGTALKNQLNNFYSYCAQGYPFSMMIDNLNVGFGVLEEAPGTAAQTLTVMPTLSTNPTDNFTVGRQYRIFDAYGQKRQKVTLASKTTTTLTFNEYITQPFFAGDFICEDEFLPFLEIGGNSDGFNFTNGAYLWFDWAQACQEFTSA